MFIYPLYTVSNHIIFADRWEKAWITWYNQFSELELSTVAVSIMNHRKKPHRLIKDTLLSVGDSLQRVLIHLEGERPTFWVSLLLCDLQNPAFLSVTTNSTKAAMKSCNCSWLLLITQIYQALCLMIWNAVFQSVVPGPTSLALLGSLLECKCSASRPNWLETLRVGPSRHCFSVFTFFPISPRYN